MRETSVPIFFGTKIRIRTGSLIFFRILFMNSNNLRDNHQGSVPDSDMCPTWDQSPHIPKEDVHLICCFYLMLLFPYAVLPMGLNCEIILYVW
jgi:hypothetical protein